MHHGMAYLSAIFKPEISVAAADGGTLLSCHQIIIEYC